MAIYNGDKQIHELYNGDTYIEELYNGDTKIFDAGWNTQITGTSPLSLPNARAKSTSWKIEGQSSQSGTPTPTSPIEVKGVGNGCLPSGYTEYEYVDMTTAGGYIDTGIKAQHEVFRIEIDATLVSSQGTLGAQIGVQNTSTHLIYNNNFYIGNDASVGGGNIFSSTTRGTVILESTADKHYSITKYDGTVATGTYTGTIISGKNYYLYGMNAASFNGNSTGKIYSVKFYDDGVLVGHFVPAKNSNNEIGMYNIVDNTFHKKQGGGTIVVGPEHTSYVVPILKAENCGMVDLGTLTWAKREYSSNKYFFTTFTDAPDTNPSTVANMYSTLPYDVVSFGGRKNKCIFLTTNFFQQANSLYIRDDSLAELAASEFKQAMSGKYLYYQRTTDTTWTVPTISNVYLDKPLLKLSNTYLDYVDSVDVNKAYYSTCIKTLDGTENYSIAANNNPNGTVFGLAGAFYNPETNISLCTHFARVSSSVRTKDIPYGCYREGTSGEAFICYGLPNAGTTVDEFKTWLASQYAAGTPVKLYTCSNLTVTDIPTVPTINTVKGQNYIDIETEIQPSNVEVVYRKKTK